MEDYDIKYRFTFESVHGVEYEINIWKYGYTGDVIYRRLGRAPVIKMRKNGPICGTSLELYAECAVDGEFAEFFSAGARDYYVEVVRAQAGNVIWDGFITPELYSEPSIAPPYDVEIVATDGLGELKLHDFQAMGLVTLREMLCTILEQAMPDAYVYMISRLAVAGDTEQDFLELQVNMDYMVGKTYYDVLTRLLESLHMVVLRNGSWYIARETDIAFNSSDGISAVAFSSAASNRQTLYNRVKTAGQMGVADMWPIGYLSTKIEPAKKSVKIAMPWHMVNVIANPDIQTPGGTATGWTIDNARATGNGIEIGEWGTNHLYTFGKAYQWIPFEGLTYPLHVSARIFGEQGGSLDNAPNRLACYLQWVPENGGANQYFYNGKWSDTAPTSSTVGYITPENNGIYLFANRDAASEYKWDIPQLGDSNPGQLCVVLCGDHIKLYHAELEVDNMNKGYEDTIKIDNGARGEGDDVEIIGGRFASAADCISVAAYNGILVDSLQEACTHFSDRLFSNKDFLSITALGYAESVALPRFRTTGKLDVPASIAYAPLLIKTVQGGATIYSWIETYERDLLNDELNVSALSLPVAVLDVESETVTEMH